MAILPIESPKRFTLVFRLFLGCAFTATESSKMAASCFGCSPNKIVAFNWTAPYISEIDVLIRKKYLDQQSRDDLKAVEYAVRTAVLAALANEA